MTQTEIARANAERVREAAIEQFGIRSHSITMDDVARAASVSKGTVYKTFPTREALVNEMLVVYYGRTAAAMRAGLDRSDPPWQILLDSILTPTIGVAARPEITPDTLDDGPVRDSILRTQSVLEEVLQRGVETGDIRPGVHAEHLALLLRGLYLALPPYERGNTAVTREYALIILRGLRSDPR